MGKKMIKLLSGHMVVAIVAVVVVLFVVHIGTVKPVLSGHSKIYKTKILMENGSLMKV